MRSNYLGLVFLGVAAFGSAAETPRASPEQVFSEAMAAMEREGPSAQARYLHPQDLEEFKRMFLPMLRGPGESRAKEVFGAGSTWEQIQAMPAQQFYERLMAQGDELRRLVPDKKMTMQVLGSVREGELVHIVFRAIVETGGRKSQGVDVQTMRPLGNTWKLALKMSGLDLGPIEADIPDR